MVSLNLALSDVFATFLSSDNWNSYIYIVSVNKRSKQVALLLLTFPNLLESVPLIKESLSYNAL